MERERERERERELMRSILSLITMLAKFIRNIIIAFSVGVPKESMSYLACPRQNANLAYQRLAYPKQACSD